MEIGLFVWRQKQKFIKLGVWWIYISKDSNYWNYQFTIQLGSRWKLLIMTYGPSVRIRILKK